MRYTFSSHSDFEGTFPIGMFQMLQIWLVCF
jgi:hypothetical protein